METQILNTMEVEITPYKKEDAGEFSRLNYEWLNEFFVVEAHDKEMLDDPYEYIIKPGGQILTAWANGIAIGTVALIVIDEETFELAKMAVSSQSRGLGIGKKLMNAIVDYAKSVGKKRLVLESNTKLTPAINLYIKAGFKVLPLDPDTPYNRANIRMELKL